MKKLLTLIALATVTAHAATNDLSYLQKNSSGKTVERVVTLTPSTFLSVNGSGQLQVQSSSAFLSAIGGATAAQGAKADTALQPGAAATTLNMVTARILGRTTSATGAVEELTASQVKTLLAITSSDVSNFTTAVQSTGDARYPQLSGSYADPAWITSLAWSKLTGVPVFLTPTGDGSGLTNLNASAIASGTVPDARFPATLPAASGANLTALNASNLGSGTVPAARLTSANLPNITLTLSGVLHTSPVTISGGSGTAALANQNANIIFAGPASGGAAVPTFRSLVATDLPAATTSAQGASVLASDAEIQTGSDTAKVVRPSGLAAWWTWVKTQAQTLASNLTVNGNTTLGDASGDSLTINAGTLTAANATGLASSNLANVGSLKTVFSTPFNVMRETLSNMTASSSGLTIWTGNDAVLTTYTAGTPALGSYAIARLINTPVNNSSGKAAATSGFGICARFQLPGRAGVQARMVYGGLASSTDVTWGSLANNGWAVEAEADNPWSAGYRWRLIVKNDAGTTVSSWSANGSGAGGGTYAFIIHVYQDASNTYAYTSAVDYSAWQSTWVLQASVNRVMATTLSDQKLSFAVITPVTATGIYSEIRNVFYTYNITP